MRAYMNKRTDEGMRHSTLHGDRCAFSGAGGMAGNHEVWLERD